MPSLLEVRDLHTYFNTKKGTIKAVNGLNYEIEAGKILGIAGESGSGKSVSSYSILNLLEEPGEIVKGEINFLGEDLTKVPVKRMRKIRGNEISMIFQEPMTSLNPVFKVGTQIMEPLILHQKLSKLKARETAIKLLKDVKIPNPETVIDCYPFELSGGMRQRIMIAIALACKPKLLIADEPTTALDVTIQAQIFKLMLELQEKNNTAILFITHDLGVIAEMCDDVVIMYCGQAVEYASVKELFSSKPKFRHPYTQGLLKSIPKITEDLEKLDQIDGTVPHPLKLPKGCKFAPRCPKATEQCISSEPELVKVSSTHKIRCFFPEVLDE